MKLIITENLISKQLEIPEITGVYDLLTRKCNGIITSQAPIIISGRHLDILTPGNISLCLVRATEPDRVVEVPYLYKYTANQVIASLPFLMPGKYSPVVRVTREGQEEVMYIFPVTWLVRTEGLERICYCYNVFESKEEHEKAMGSGDISPEYGNDRADKDTKEQAGNNPVNKFESFMKEYGVHAWVLVLSVFLMLAGFVAVMLLLFSACGQPRTNIPPGETVVAAVAGHEAAVAAAAEHGAAGRDSIHALHYTHPAIPLMMTDSGQRAAYYVQHYWDGYSLADTAFISSDDTELLYADFIDALQHASPEARSSALCAMMIHAEADSTAYTRFCTLSEKYLYDPNSPMRNEDYYICILEQMLASKRLSEADKLRPADRLEQALRNRPGMVAPDFGYVTPEHLKESGHISTPHRLHQFRADYILLFFYDPDCSNCLKYEQELSEMPAFFEMQKKGILRVLAVYTDDNGEEWLLKSSQMPHGWVVGWNKQGDISGKMLYEIRATPTMYLLDKQKKVVLKDASMEQIIRFLSAVYPRSGD